MTKHYKQLLLPHSELKWGRIMQSQGKFWLVNKDGEVAQLPHHLYLLMTGVLKPTRYFGPYIFYNNFEQTVEAKYLMTMFKYPHLTPTPEKKIYAIISNNDAFIKVDKEFVTVLMERETLISPDNIWTKEDVNDNKN